MLKKILLGAAVVLVAFLGFVATRPSNFEIKRSTTVRAPASVVYGLVADFNKVATWSPFMKPDPVRKDTYAGVPATVGHSVTWTSTDNSSEGKMTIASLKPPEQIQLQLDFVKPFEATNETVFRFEPAGNDTRVTWVMSGQNGFLSKAFSVFMDVDKMVGSDFEAGLATLKDLAEAEAKASASAAGSAAPNGAVATDTVK